MLAAGLSTRMKSDVPKVMHEVCGRPLLRYVLDTVLTLAPDRLVVVTAPGHDEVESIMPPPAERAIQSEQRGTGDAARAGVEALGSEFDGDVMVLYGDVPLVGADLLQGLLARHRDAAAAATITAVTLAEPGSYGRVLRGPGGAVRGIVEFKDATADERAIKEVNAGLYVFAARDLRAVLPRLRADNAQGELYLTDVVGLLLAGRRPVVACESDDEAATMGVNSRVELAAVTAVMRRRLLERLMLAGVTVDDPATTYVDADVDVGRDTVVRPQTTLAGATRIGAGCDIGPSSYLEDVTVHDGARITHSYLVACEVGPSCTVGPFAYVRPGTVLAEGAKAGTFVEIKNSRVGARSKVPHLSYVGDTTIGQDTNIGAGNITANYDGVRKHPTTIGDRVHTGSDTVFVAPVTVGDDAYTAAGSTITKDIPDGALGVARERQVNIEDYAERRRIRDEGDE